ncbi:MAG: hypothetical protein ACI9K3_001718 [Halovenus sp.]|jgi:hypothetical protein
MLLYRFRPVRRSGTPKWPAEKSSDMTESESGEYDPASPEPPAREPPRRGTAPQSEYTTRQVAVGFLVLAVGLAVVVGVALTLA